MKTISSSTEMKLSVMYLLWRGWVHVVSSSDLIKTILRVITAFSLEIVNVISECLGLMHTCTCCMNVYVWLNVLLFLYTLLYSLIYHFYIFATQFWRIISKINVLYCIFKQTKVGRHIVKRQFHKLKFNLQGEVRKVPHQKFVDSFLDIDGSPLKKTACAQYLVL